MLRVGVVTRHDDFHAVVIRKILEERGVSCSLLHADSLVCNGGLSWEAGGPHGLSPGVVRDSAGRQTRVSELDVIWFRRLNGEPQIPVALADDTARELVVNDCQAAFIGLL